MKTYTLTYHCHIDAPAQAVCDFHTDTHNLPLITPPWINVKIVSMDNPMTEGSQVVLEIRRFYLPTLWNIKIETLQCPKSLTDVMVSGPFKSFRHERKFTSITPDKSTMDETITLELPLGWIGGFLFPLIKKDMDKMFSYRHQATQRYFDSGGLSCH